MAPTRAPLKQYADPDAPRLEIDETGFARAVFPGRTKKRRLSAENDEPRLIIDERGAAEAVFPNEDKKKKTSAIAAGLHLRIGRHRESYVRTKLIDPDEATNAASEEKMDTKDVTAPPAAFTWPTNPAYKPKEVRATASYIAANRAAVVSNGQNLGKRSATSAATARLVVGSETENAGEVSSGPVNRNRSGATLPMSKSEAKDLQPDALQLQLRLGFEVERENNRYAEEHHHRRVPQGQQHNIGHMPILPSVVFFKRGDATTRLRYAVDILTINDEKFIRLDHTQYLYAVQVEHQVVGENQPNETLRQAQYIHWQADRDDGRPEVLFELYPKGELAYTPETKRRKKAPQDFRPACDNYGRVLLTCSDRPLKHSDVMPVTVSTDIEGWEMEAICRLDPDVCHQDFLDRMLPETALGGKVRPSKGTLNHRRRRDRMRLRILPWPLPGQLSYSDQQVVKELDQWQLENNTTRSLRDLSKEEIEMHEAIMYGGHFERSGTSKALNDQSRLDQMMVNLRLVRSKFADGSEEVAMVKGRIVSLASKMGVEGNLGL